MHFLLVLLRLVLDRLISSGRDGLSMAARADGRVEHIPARLALWQSWLRLRGQAVQKRTAERRRQQQEKVRAGRRTSPVHSTNRLTGDR